MFCVGAPSLYAVGTEIPKLKNVPSFTFCESQEVSRFFNKIFCIQHIVMTLSHHKFHTNTELLP